MYEESFFHLLNALHRRHPLDRLCIAGGCGANSVANGKVTALTPFKQVYVQAAAGDAGGALGAALDVWHQLGHPRCQPMGAAYLGYSPEASVNEALFADPQIIEHLRSSNCSVVRLGDSDLPNEFALLDQVTMSLTEGEVVGWFEGRMEWGFVLSVTDRSGDPRRRHEGHPQS